MFTIVLPQVFALSSIVIWFMLIQLYSESYTSSWHSLAGSLGLYLFGEAFLSVAEPLRKLGNPLASVLRTVQDVRVTLLFCLLVLVFASRIFMPRRQRRSDEETPLIGDCEHYGSGQSRHSGYPNYGTITSRRPGIRHHGNYGEEPHYLGDLDVIRVGLPAEPRRFAS